MIFGCRCNTSAAPSAPRLVFRDSNLRNGRRSALLDAFQRLTAIAAI